MINGSRVRSRAVAATAETRRVLKLAGKLLFVEHGLACLMKLTGIPGSGTRRAIARSFGASPSARTSRTAGR